ncbi:uncharacterized protein LOC131950949 isoform X2 [Physella acuta]|uniref:uncharacterized protein LOC131950949 isoform X2 n=1 Tax=Physella acuta TaxID=109671 RepID=UPI0027DDD897|nr:uncharacterized protein LOC131950949 isoform X2 [Physella acuta]
MESLESAKDRSQEEPSSSDNVVTFASRYLLQPLARIAIRLFVWLVNKVIGKKETPRPESIFQMSGYNSWQYPGWSYIDSLRRYVSTLEKSNEDSTLWHSILGYSSILSSNCTSCLSAGFIRSFT